VSSRVSLPDKVLALDAALATAPHAFGGALALAYYAEPRGTVDIDLNIFVPMSEADQAIEPLAALGIKASRAQLEQARRDGQVRLHWDDTPVDLFFSYDAFHDAAATKIRRVPFASATIPILAAEHLTVCKVVFDRPKDWVDIAAMREAGTQLDALEVLRWVERIVGDTDSRYARIVGVLTS
jgi:hypothetical protein